MARFFQQAFAAISSLSCAVVALGTNYDHDGKTTYCWHIDEPASNSRLSELDRTQEYSGSAGCPIAMTVALDATTVEVNTPVNVTWTVTADFSGSNLVNMTRLAYGQDSSGRTAQIVHSNVHSCVYLSGCDPFYDGEQLEDKTSNQIANLTDNGADFQDAVQFSTVGPYSVLAHIIMPDTNSSKQFAFAVYTKLTVTEAKENETTEAPAATTTDSSGGISQAAIIGIVVGGVVVVVSLIVVAVVAWRRQGGNNINDMSNYSYPPPPPYDAVSELYSIDPKDGSDAGTARVTGSWSNPANSQPARSLDGTNGANGSRSSHPTAQDYRGADHDGYTSYGGGYNPVEPDRRPRRVDSDVEL